MIYHAGDIVEGKVTGIQPYGAFVALDEHVSGLIHISEISDGYVRDINYFVKVGDIVRVKVIDFDETTNQARLSLKALHRPRANVQNHTRRQKASLPPGDIGFRTIEEHMPEWIALAKAQIKKP